MSFFGIGLRGVQGFPDTGLRGMSLAVGITNLASIVAIENNP